MGGGTIQLSRQNTTTTTEAVTAQQSLALVKNLLRVGLSQVTYIRGLFGEPSFEEKQYCDIKVQQLLPNTPESKTLIGWLEKGVFDALQRGFLKAVVFGISVPEPSSKRRKTFKTIETYQWKIGYTDTGDVMINGERVGSSKEQLKAQAIRLIRALIVFSQTLDVLPDERILTMELSYTDKTPQDYEPAFFRAAAQDGSDRVHIDEAGSLKVKIGSITTPHLALDLKFVGLPDAAAAAAPGTSPAPFVTSESLLMPGHGPSAGGSALAHGTHGGKTPAPTPASPPKPKPQTPVEAFSSLSLDDGKAQAAPATVKQARARGRAAEAGATEETSSSSAVVMSSVVGESEFQQVKSHIVQHGYRVGSYVPIVATAKALNLTKNQVEAAFRRLAREGGALEEKPWGAVSRYLIRRLPPLEMVSEEAEAEAEQEQEQEEDKMVVVEGAGAEGQTAGHRTPSEGANTPPADLLKGGGGGDDDSDVETVGSPVAAPRQHQHQHQQGGGAVTTKRLATDCLLEQGSGFDISLTQDSTAAAGRKISVVQDPIKQRAPKKSRQ